MAVDVLRNINNLVDSVIDLKGVWIHLFADLTFKLLPVEASYICDWDFLLFLQLQPLLEAVEVNEAYGARALARHNQRILGVRLTSPADAALILLLLSAIVEILECFDVLRLA